MASAARSQDFYVNLLVQEWQLDWHSREFRERVRRVLRELNDDPQRLLLEPRLEVRVLDAPDSPGPDVWAYFPFHRGRFSLRRHGAGYKPPTKPKPLITTTCMLVFNAEKFEEEAAEQAERHLRHHLGHTLLFLLLPDAPNECSDADEEWCVWRRDVQAAAEERETIATLEQETELGLCLSGNWRECDAMVVAYERGSIVVEESEFCEKVECSPDHLSDYLRSNWREHSISAVAHGDDEVEQDNISLVRQFDRCFIVRLFSPLNPNSEIVQRLRAKSVSPRRM